MSQISVLVVDDDLKIRTLLREVLEAEGFAVSEAETAVEAMARIRSAPPSLVTLDLRLGADNGLEIARDIRAVSAVPIIMLTSQDDVIDRVVGLELGADDYITKPFHIREVVARVRSVLRRTASSGRPEHTEAAAPPPEPRTRHLRFDDMTANLDLMELHDRDGMSCELTHGDFRLLKVFLERPMRALSRDQLMDLTNGAEWNPLDRTIDNQVARLRKKIERDPQNPKLIKTIRGVGYMFASDVITCDGS